MAKRYLEQGETIEVGDYIISENSLGYRYLYDVVRITKTMVIARLRNYDNANDYRFSKVYDYRFSSIPKQKWNTTVYRIVREEKENEPSG